MMDIVKKNMVSIIAGVVALVAVAAIFYPISGYFEDLRTRAGERAAVFPKVSGLSNKQRNWPNTSLDANAPLKPLEVYPTNPIIEKGLEIVNKVKSESGAVYKTAWEEFNKRSELLPGALPDGSSGNKTRFVNQYRMALDMKSDTRMNSPLIKILQAGFVPSADVITARKVQVREEVMKGAIRGPGNQIMNQNDLDDEIKLLEARVPLMLRREVAEKSLVYISDNSLDLIPALAPGGSGSIPEIQHIWAAQVGYWVQEDVCRAISSANEGSKNVMESPVKRLINVRVNNNASSVFKGVGMGTAVTPSDKPDPARAFPQANYLNSITGRYACPLYDVLPFSVTLLADATKIDHILQSLSRNKFITITNCYLEVEDNGNLEPAGYFVGTSPVVTMNITAEAIFFREWTIPLLPPNVRRGLGLPEDAPAAPK